MHTCTKYNAVCWNSLLHSYMDKTRQIHTLAGRTCAMIRTGIKQPCSRVFCLHFGTYTLKIPALFNTLWPSLVKITYSAMVTSRCQDFPSLLTVDWICVCEWKSFSSTTHVWLTAEGQKWLLGLNILNIFHLSLVRDRCWLNNFMANMYLYYEEIWYDLFLFQERAHLIAVFFFKWRFKLEQKQSLRQCMCLSCADIFGIDSYVTQPAVCFSEIFNVCSVNWGLSVCRVAAQWLPAVMTSSTGLG